MRIIINYDLMDRISEAKQGYSIERCNKDAIGLTAIVNLVAVACHMPVEYLTITLPAGVGLTWISKKYSSLALDEMDDALDDLDYLSSDLEEIHVHTNRDLLLESEVYKKEYKFKSGKYKMPYVLEKKYISVPTIKKNKEVSLLQEHILGNKEYFISKGRISDEKSLVRRPSWA